MAEDFVSAELVLPGTYIRVRSDGLVGVRGISAGNIGIVGVTRHAAPPSAPAGTPPPPPPAGGRGPCAAPRPDHPTLSSRPKLKLFARLRRCGDQ